MRAETGLLKRPSALVTRSALLCLVAILVWVVTRDAQQLWWPALLAVAGIPAVLTAHQTLITLGRFAEVVVVGLAAGAVAVAAMTAGVSGPGFAASAVLPYLCVPLAAAGLAERGREALALLAVAVAVLTVGGVLSGNGPSLLEDPRYVLACAQWLALASLVAAAVGMVWGGARQAAVTAPPAGPAPFEEATRLLTQLRSVARQLPGATLDPGSIAEHLLDEVKSIARCDRAAVLTASGGGRLVVLTESGVDRAEWETTIDADSAVAEAWASQTAQTAARSQTRSHRSDEVSSMVVPLIAGVRTVGLMIIEADVSAGYPADVVDRVVSVSAAAALRLEAALLFDEVRSIATNEERQRLAREIHDGVAQELVMVGYGIDNALAMLPEAGSDDSAETLRSLRGEVTRVITELRLSLFELRSEVDRHGGLAAAIAEYARTVGASAGLRVHLSLDESTNRMPAATEAELLRIAQEAITNARKHAGASNLWVTCEVDPPYARIAVEDDGRGLPDHRPDGHYGLAIMRERTNRVRGRLEINPRHPNGTSVAVVVGSPPGRDSVRDSVNAAETE
ncbi:GAF domain-containing sensor histidine kinase [Pilimelia columellifera]|uniref:Histidine kinase/HSP90-like ATPase domain-containing protein n=1 Tax=Pilimelia columellifera subsp. columellifera TaxID=706583 RepID=A0ABN3NB55_9ACTN